MPLSQKPYDLLNYDALDGTKVGTILEKCPCVALYPIISYYPLLDLIVANLSKLMKQMLTKKIMRLSHLYNYNLYTIEISIMTSTK